MQQYCLSGKAWVLKVQWHKHVLIGLNSYIYSMWMHAVKSTHNVVQIWNTESVWPCSMTSACHLVVSLLMLTMFSEVRERGKVRHCQREPMMAANDWRKFYRQDGQMIVFSIMLFLCRSTSTIEWMNNYSYNYSYIYRIIIQRVYSEGINVCGFLIKHVPVFFYTHEKTAIPRKP